MSKSRSDLDEKLAELSLWQEEQQKKLKAFQEAQKKLLDMEHQNILSTLRTQNINQSSNKNEDKATYDLPEKHKTEKSLSPSLWFNYKEAADLMQLRLESIKLVEPKSIGLDIKSHPPLHQQKELFCSENVENFEENSSCQPRKFLKRGEGLARFRMTLDDFKAPPKIYKERKIKTYLNGKPETNIKKINNRSVKVSKNNPKGNKNIQCNVANKGKSVPVKIYVPENKNGKCGSARNLDSKPKEFKKNCNINLPKAPVQDLSLRPCSIATEWYNLMKEKQKIDKKDDECKDIEIIDLEKENKKDEKELHVFEVLEKKVDESSFCSNSSFVEKLMEQSLSSTPSKSFGSDLPKKFYAQGLKTLCSQFLGDENLKKLEESCDFLLQVTPEPELEKKEIHEEPIVDKTKEEKEDEVEEDGEKVTLRKEEPEKKIETPQPHRVNRSLLQEYIRDFKQFKSVLAENSHRIKQPDDVSAEEEPKVEVETNERDIALKLRRKGLQDNVKHLLNWDCPSRKRQPKRVTKKAKPKPTKADRLKGENEKIIFDSTLLKTRLDELEREIGIFRKENQNLERLQKECNEEKQKLAKDRKEFEKQMQEEREKWEAKILEDQKKLQKERIVFEKYCKQVKNQPTRQEREEISNLKKELEKVTETLATKEARWGASQARLRNQIKALEKEISLLKSENQKLQKLSLKKVSFENEKSLNTKIINVINAELGKLRPAVVKTVSGNGGGSGRQPLSARSEKHTENNPIRRIKSVPDIKGQAEEDVSPEVTNDFEDKALGSVSTDSGIDTNGSRKPQVSRAREDLQKKGSLLGQTCEFLSSSRSPAEEMIQSVVCEALFGKDKTNSASLKINEMKNRLERLTLQNSENRSAECQSGVISRLAERTEDCKNSESEEESRSWTEEEEEESEDEEEKKEERKEIQMSCVYENKNYPLRKEFGTSSIIESKLEETGVWEKIYEDGSKEITYPNGNIKKIFPGHRIVKMVYYNGDIKETNIAEGSEKYYYAETKTWHTTYKDGLEVLEFPNGQTERRHPDGSTEISFPNGCVRYCDPSGRDEWRFLDGTVIKTNEEGHKILLMPNGQKEIHTNDYKRREYPDGTVKILYSDGTQETRYATGRVRLKDKDGNLLMDSGGIR